MKNISARELQLMPDGIPRYIRCYDNQGETADRYTVVFTGHYRKSQRDDFVYVGMNAYPFDPQGIGQHGFSDSLIDRPTYSHLGKKITFQDLPKDCKKAVLLDYKGIWNIK
jgi:hypothetical protein